MNVPDVEELYNYVLMYGGELPTALIPTGLGAELPVPCTEEAKLTRVVMIRRHLDHIVESNLAAVSKVRTKTHNKVQKIWMALLKNVGAAETDWENRAWDMGKHKSHRRPDITTTLIARLALLRRRSLRLLRLTCQAALPHARHAVDDRNWMRETQNATAQGR